MHQLEVRRGRFSRYGRLAVGGYLDSPMPADYERPCDEKSLQILVTLAPSLVARRSYTTSSSAVEVIAF